MLFVSVIEDYWRELLLNICQPIYKLIVYLYELFEVVGTAEILMNETLSILYNRVGLILGLYMMFRIVFSFIQMLINPDYISDKEKGIGNIVKKTFLVVILLAIVPFLFNKAFEFQNYIVGADGDEPNVIAKLVFPSEIVKGDNFGVTLSSYLFTSFYRYDDGYQPETASDACYLMEGNTLHQVIVTTKGNVGPAKYCLLDNDDYKATYKPQGSSSQHYKISFTWNGVFAIVVGLVVCYTLITYVLYVGARVVQLAFLRIISPMAILGYLSPKKDGMFEKWLKMCVTTYIDLFIRMGIIYFIVYIIYVIIGSENGIALSKPFDDIWIVNIVMILALLIFAKKAPELIKELFPKSGVASLGFGIKSPKKLFDDMAGGTVLYKGLKTGAKGAAGLAIGASIGGIGNALRGAVNDKDNRLRGLIGGLAGGTLSGGLAGAKAKGILKSFGASNKAASAQNKRIVDWRANGGESTLARWGTGFQQKMGFTTTYENLEAEYSQAKKYADAYSSAKKKADSEVDKFASNYYFKDASGKSYSLLEIDKMRNDDVHYSAKERAMFDTVYNNIHGLARDHAMQNSGAVKSGSVVWTDNGTGDWKDIEKTIDDTAVVSYSTNSEIQSNMDYVLSSDVANSTSGSRFEKAKAANDSYEDRLNNKINDDRYNQAKANYDSNKGSK